MKKYKHLFIGIFIGVLLATAIPAGAAAVYKSLNAVERPDYKIVVDGNEVKLNNPPKTIEGSAHLPIRDIADIFGSDVDFKNKTITLTTKESNDEGELNMDNWVSLEELKRTHGLIYSVGLPEGADPNSTLRETTIKIGDKIFLFETPHIIFGSFSIINEDGIELKIIDSERYLHESVISTTS